MKSTPWIVSFILLVLVSCNKYDNIETADYQAEFALPLVNSNLIVEDLIEDLDTFSFITVDPDGLIRLVFAGDTIRQDAQVIFDGINNFPSFPIPILINPFPLPVDVIPEVNVDSAVLKAGGLAILSLTNPEPDSITFTLNIPQIRQGDSTFQFSVILPPNSSFTNPGNPLDLTGFAITPQSGAVVISYTARKNNGDAVNINDLILQFSDLSFGFVAGSFATLPIEGISDTILIDFFESFEDGSFLFDDPIALIDVESTIGIPTRVVVEAFNANPAPRTGNPNPAPIALEPQGLAFDLNFPTNPGDTALTRIVIDKNNSNIDELLNSAPISVDYQLDGVINPAGGLATGYAADTGYLEGIVTLELPLVGSVTDYLARDTFDLSLDEDLEDASEAIFRLTATNEIPLDIAIRLDFEDELGNPLLTLLPDAPVIIEGAPVDSEGNSVGETLKVTDIPLTEEELDLVLQASIVILRARFSTTDTPQIVRITDEDLANIRLGLRVTLSN